MAQLIIQNSGSQIQITDSATGAYLYGSAKDGTQIQFDAENEVITLFNQDNKKYSFSHSQVQTPVTATPQALISILSEYLIETVSVTGTTQTADYLLIGGNGTDYINAASGAVTGKSYAAVVANGDTVFAVLEDSAGQDIMAYSGIGTNVLSKGMTFRARNGLNIAEVTITSGSVIGIINY